MLRLSVAFLSHSSKDKKGYVEIVARKIGYHKCVYDELTFEEGMKSLEEIEKGLNKTDLFVIFISNSALESDWVKRELNEAFRLLNEGNIKRILPIIIDPHITYEDQRLPKWLREEYNLKYVARPTVASRRIIQRLREISWECHPKLKEKERIFVGRNDLIKSFEERIDSFDLPTPLCFIASGIKEIGRRSLLKKCFVKANIFEESYQPPIIFLNSHEGIEDFIYRIYDLGFSGTFDLSDFMTTKLEDKIGIAIELIKDVQNSREIIFIIDNGCLITPDREVNKWFKAILEELKYSDRITFAVASSFRANRNNIRKMDYLYYLEVPELEKKERDGLLKRYSYFEGLELLSNDFKYFSGLLNGFPQQVYYAVDLIKDLGIPKAKKDCYLLVEFNSERVNLLLSKYGDDEKAINFLCFLSEFDFIDYDIIFEVVGEDQYFIKLLDEFFALAICENLGANKEYIRVNDAIRDYVRRNRLSLPEEYKAKLEEHIKKFLKDYKDEEKSAADLLYSMKEALLAGEKIDQKYLIPSQFLKTMTELYHFHKRYNEIVKLADRVLLNEEFIDERVVTEIRYFLCMALARLRDKRFLDEVQYFDGPNHNFLFGFYYRLTGNYRKAIERLETALAERPNFSFAERELVQVYLYIEEYGKALELAKQNYEKEKNNPYHIQAYFRCLIRQGINGGSESKIEELLENLSKVKSEKGKEMYLTAKAEYLAFYKNEEELSVALINEAINQFPNVYYSRLVKFNICEKFNRIDDMKYIVETLEAETDKGSHFYSIFINLKAIYLAKIGLKDEALKLVLGSIRNYPENSLDKIIKQIESITPLHPNSKHKRILI